METLNKPDFSNSTNVSMGLTNLSLNRPSFEQELCAKEFSSYVCRAGKLSKQSLLRDDCSEHNFDLDVLTPGHSLTYKKRRLVNALGFTNNLATLNFQEDTKKLCKEANDKECFLKAEDFHAISHHIATPKENDKFNDENQFGELKVSRNNELCHGCDCITF